MNECLHHPPVDEGDALEPGFVAVLASAVGLGLIIAGVGAFSAGTVALVWSALN